MLLDNLENKKEKKADGNKVKVKIVGMGRNKFARHYSLQPPPMNIDSIDHRRNGREERGGLK
jgi:hypothetical protein